MSESTGLKIVFAGTPEFAAHHLKYLLESDHNVVAVYTQPDRPSGRGKKLSPSPVKEVALAAGLPVYQPESLKSTTAQAELLEIGADIMVVVAYGLLLPEPVLATPRLGCINVHASLLPRLRGAAPIQRAIEAGDSHTGITIMQMDVGLDTGDMLEIVECPILPDDTAASLHDRLAELGPPSLVKSLAALATGTAHATPQDNSQATYAKKLTKEEAEIQWQQPAQTIALRIRAFNPFPVAFTVIGTERLRIFNAEPVALAHQKAPGTLLQADKKLVVACGDGTALEITTLQLPGKKAMAARDALNGSGQLFQALTQFGQSTAA